MSVTKYIFKVALLAPWFAYVCVLAVTWMSGALSAQTIEQDEAGSGFEYSTDCTDITIDFEDDPTLTREEKTALMEEAFFRSLSKFDACQEERSKTNTANSGGRDSVGGGDSSPTSGLTGTETSEPTAGIDTAASTASSDMSGSDGSVLTNKSQNSSTVIRGGEPESKTETKSSNGIQTNDMDNSKVPDDISSADNDSILEAQIRQAATDETDPEVRAKLWNEYRRYKGMPQVN